jgi:hypothetical protein
MLANHALEYVALFAAVAGLVGVLAEIVVKDPSVLGHTVTRKAAALGKALRGLDVAPVASQGRLAA